MVTIFERKHYSERLYCYVSDAIRAAFFALRQGVFQFPKNGERAHFGSFILWFVFKKEGISAVLLRQRVQHSWWLRLSHNRLLQIQAEEIQVQGQKLVCISLYFFHNSENNSHANIEKMERFQEYNGKFFFTEEGDHPMQMHNVTPVDVSLYFFSTIKQSQSFRNWEVVIKKKL